MIGKLKDLTINRDESQNITVTVDTDFREMFDKLKNDDVYVEIKKASKKRSMDANSYFWYLCGEIAKHSSRFSNDGKNDVYREAIRAKGVWEEVFMRADVVDTFMHNWSEHGLGWFAEVVDEKVNKKGVVYKQVHVFSGSSTYDSASMSHIIDYVVNIADDLGIPTITANAQLKLLQSWADLKGENDVPTV